MNTADLISAYLNNEMSPEQERQFLLSVAASDSLRLSLKSHVMLDRIVFQQARDTRVPDGVRGAIFAEMSASLAANGVSSSSSVSPSVDGLRTTASTPSGVVASVSRFGIVKGLSIALLALSGFGAGYITRLGVEAPLAVRVAAAPLLQQNAGQLQSLLFSSSMSLLSHIPVTLNAAELGANVVAQIGPGASSGITPSVRHRLRAHEQSDHEPVQKISPPNNAESVQSIGSPVNSDMNAVKPNNPLQPNIEKPDGPVSPSADAQSSNVENDDSGKAPATIHVDGATVLRSNGSTVAPRADSPKQ